MAVDWWQSELFKTLSWCASGVSGRNGGVSVAPFRSLNLVLHIGDDPRAVVANRKSAATSLGFAIGDMVCAEQIHGGGVAGVNRTFCGRGATDLEEAIPGVDAMVTDSPGVLLALFFADCIPVLLADPQNRVVAVAHAGWRGIVSDIVEGTVATMVSEFGAAPQDIVAAIGPGIGECCFEVGAEVAAQFPADCVRWIAGQSRPRVDLKEDVARRLRGCGVADASIAIADECTSCLPDRYFSFRRDSGQTGRMAAMIGIIPE